MKILLDLLIKFSSSVILMTITVYSWHKLIGRKFNLKNFKTIITILLLSVISIANYYIVNQYVRIFSITLILMFLFWFLFNETLQKCIITPIFSQMIVMIAEMIFVVIVCAIFNMNGDGVIDTQFGQFFSNFIISIFVLLIVKIPLIKKIYLILIKITDKISKKQLIVLSFLLIIIANALVGILYYKIEFKYLLILNTLLTLFCLFIVIISLKNKSDYMKVYDKYNTTLNSLKEYEDILDRYRISNHENKNQLLTIRNMVPKTNQKVISFIDKIIENKLKDNDTAMFEATKIPAGGLRGLIYSKILTMKNLKIDYELEISNSVKTEDLINIDDSLMLDVCQVIGVYIDNAIQAVEKIDEKFVNIEMYIDDKDLVISVSNNYEGTIEIEKLEQKGYTSKGKGHGYGLSLTKDIIEKNKKLTNEKSITKDTFTQTLKIKM